MSFDKLSRYLQLDANQIAEVSEINTYFENQLGQPLSAEALCNNARPEETRNALLCNLKLMKRALTKDQYRKYVALINGLALIRKIRFLIRFWTAIWLRSN